MFPDFDAYQGPALYAWNSAVFKGDDWTSLGKINQSSKEEDVLKVGRFGLGFQSVFHITGIMCVCNNDRIMSIIILSYYV
jgi:sacsin